MSKKQGIKIIVLSIFFCFFGVITAAPVVIEFVDKFQLKNWDKSDGNIISISYEEYKCRSLCGKDTCKKNTDSISCYRPKVEYKYQIDGVDVKGSSYYQPSVDKPLTKGEIDEVMKALTVGSKVTVSYRKINNGYNSYIYLYENYKGKMFFLFVSIACLCISAILIFQNIRNKE